MDQIRYRFEIHYQSKSLKELSDFLKTCDLGIDLICNRDIIQFTYVQEEKPISYFKHLIKQGMEAIDAEVVKIEGGKVE